MSALGHACLAGNLECVKMLIAAKADLRLMDNHKQTPVHKAAIVVRPRAHMCACVCVLHASG